MLHESVVDDQRQRGICWQVKDFSYVPIKHPTIKTNVLRANNESLLLSLNRLPVGEPGRIEPERNETFCIKDGQMNRGEFYSRIMRPIFGEGTIQPGQTLKNHYDHNVLRNIQKQEEILIETLEVVFRSIHPHESNFDVYGHQIRNLIILAATEVESSLIAILEANDVSPLNRHYTTHDYVRLNNFLKLDAYEVSLTHYPWLQPLTPFRQWDSAKPTKSLSWYDSYNKIKHNREIEFNEAKLIHAINAIVAVHILLVSQFGTWGTYNPYFKVSSKPDWLREELYIPPENQDSWLYVNIEI